MEEETEAINNNNDSKACSALTMTSFDHDDSIEIISSQVVSTPVAEDSVYTELTSVDVTSFDYDVTSCHTALPEDKMPVLTRGPSKKKIVPIPPPPTKKEKRIKGAVMVLGTLLIVMCLVLVAVTLSMSDHIDEMVRKLNGQTTTPASIPTTKPYNGTR